ncbi:MAG: hypothetical protein A2498_14625 [Lentisphaerae bacterium RIFOXYC12_FULL_60_16]|nr:MAG: hypothetical protein A2498_14625 [Lentisphaerae bacterium RIFOXYC12_FULL_60_16]OGV83965.1 MAG: hypothetical protein A2340_16145 [Lentisphaerae bacterium RIFOXYB12_FULL_60_10]
MDIQVLRTWLMWCTIMSGSLLVLWALLCVFAMERVYRLQTRWFPMPRETFMVVMYGFLGLFKTGFLLFHAIPYVALLIMG